MKKLFLASVALLCIMLTVAQAQLDRSKIPGPGPAPAIAFPDYDVLTTPNGIRVIIVKNSELPTVSISLLIDRKPDLEKGDAGLHRHRRPAFTHRDNDADKGSA